MTEEEVIALYSVAADRFDGEIQELKNQTDKDVAFYGSVQASTKDRWKSLQSKIKNSPEFRAAEKADRNR